MFDHTRVFTSTSQKELNTYQEGFLLPVLPVRDLLSGPKQRTWIRQLRELVNLSDAHFEILYEGVIENYASYVQVIPTQPKGVLCGLLNEGLARSILVMKHNLLGDTDFPKDTLYHYALFTAVLLADIAKLMTNQRIFFTNEKGQFIEDWQALRGNLLGIEARYYKLYEVFSPSYERMSRSLTPMLAQKIMPAVGLNWLLSDMRIFMEWLDLLSGETQQRGRLINALGLIESGELLRLLAELQDIPVEMIKESSNQLGDTFFEWLKENLSNGEIRLNSNESGVHWTQEGIFLERHVFENFAENAMGSPDAVQVYDQFCDLFGVDQGDLLSRVRYAETEVRRGESFATPITRRAVREGLLLADPALLAAYIRNPAVSPLLKSLQEGGQHKQQLKIQIPAAQTKPTLQNSPN